MMNKLFFLLAIFLFSCSENKEAKMPANVLPKDKMIEVMVDVNILEAINSLNLLVDNKSDTLQQYSSILKNHDVTKEQYNESIQFYTAHPELFNEIYEGVINQLSKQQVEEGAK